MESINKNPKPYQGIDRSKWSIQDYINEGITITREAQEGDALYRKNFIAVDMHNVFVIWRISVRDFLFKEGYLNDKHPLYSLAEPILEADSVPNMKGGNDYGVPQSEKSQTLLKNIREETKKKLEILRSIKASKLDRISAEIVLNIKNHELVIGKNKILWDSSSLEWSIFHVLVKRDEETSWDEILEHYEGEKPRNIEKQQKQVGDARDRINKKVIKESPLKEKLIGRKNNQYRFIKNVTKSD